MGMGNWVGERDTSQKKWGHFLGKTGARLTNQDCSVHCVQLNRKKKKKKEEAVISQGLTDFLPAPTLPLHHKVRKYNDQMWSSYIKRGTLSRIPTHLEIAFFKKEQMLDKPPHTNFRRVRKYWRNQAHFSLLYVW